MGGAHNFFSGPKFPPSACSLMFCFSDFALFLEIISGVSKPIVA